MSSCSRYCCGGCLQAGYQWAAMRIVSKCSNSQGRLPCLPDQKLQASNSAGEGVEAGNVAQASCWLIMHQTRLLHSLQDTLHRSAYSL